MREVGEVASHSDLMKTKKIHKTCGIVTVFCNNAPIHGTPAAYLGDEKHNPTCHADSDKLSDLTSHFRSSTAMLLIRMTRE